MSLPIAVRRLSRSGDTYVGESVYILGRSHWAPNHPICKAEGSHGEKKVLQEATAAVRRTLLQGTSNASAGAPAGIQIRMMIRGLVL